MQRNRQAITVSSEWLTKVVRGVVGSRPSCSCELVAVASSRSHQHGHVVFLQNFQVAGWITVWTRYQWMLRIRKKGHIMSNNKFSDILAGDCLLYHIRCICY